MESFVNRIEDSSSDSDEKNSKSTRTHDEFEYMSQYVKSNDVVSVVVGTVCGKSDELLDTSEWNDLEKKNQLDGESLISERASRANMLNRKASMAPIKSYATWLMSRPTMFDASQVLTSDDLIDDMNDADIHGMEHMTLIDEDKTDGPPKFKRVVVTVLLTQKWRKSEHSNSTSKKKKKVKIKYLPTYRMEPKINLSKEEDMRALVTYRIRQRFHTLVEKHATYDAEYTPRFLKALTELVKNDAKSLGMDRYKVVVFLAVFQKTAHLSCNYISKELLDIESDLRICLKEEVNTFFVICLVYFIYKE